MAFKFRITHIAAAAMLASGAMAMADDAAPTPLQAAVGSVTSNGYFRAGFAEAGKGGAAECFGVGYAKFRLGNECDAYGEIGLDIPVFNQSNGAVWTAHTMVNTDIPYSADYWDTKLAFAQNYISVAKFGDGALKDAVLWAGMRYYDRPDVHMLDYKYIHGDGTGAGIENIALGSDGAMFSYAIIRPADSNDIGRTWLENLFKVSGVKAGPGAFTFNAGLTGAWHSDSTTTVTTDPVTGMPVSTTTATPKTSNGWYLSGMYDHPIGDVASNRIGLQYGRGANATGHFGEINDGSTDDSTFQVLDNITFEPKDSQWTMLGHAIYRDDSYSNNNVHGNAGDRTWWAVGVRPQYHFNDIFGFATELGYESYKQDNLNIGNENITKLTLALTAAAGKGAYSRPELRLFYTYAKWNDAAMKDPGNPQNAVTSDGHQSVYAMSTSGSSFGVQAEAWW